MGQPQTLYEAPALSTLEAGAVDDFDGAKRWHWYTAKLRFQWNRLAIQREFCPGSSSAGRCTATCWRRCDGGLEIGAHTLLEPHVLGSRSRRQQVVRIARESFLNIGVMVAWQGLVEIGDHCMFANGCFVSDADHRFDDPNLPGAVAGLHQQGADAHGRQRLVGANVVVSTQRRDGGERCVIGANSVVTRDLPARSKSPPEHREGLGGSSRARLPEQGAIEVERPVGCGAVSGRLGAARHAVQRSSERARGDLALAARGAGVAIVATRAHARTSRLKITW